MNSDELRILIETARIKKGISQRELSKQTGISRSTLNDLINGKIKKVDIDDLRKIAEALDMSLQELVKVAGYDEMSMYFRMNKAQDKYLDKSTKDLISKNEKRIKELQDRKEAMLKGETSAEFMQDAIFEMTDVVSRVFTIPSFVRYV